MNNKQHSNKQHQDKQHQDTRPYKTFIKIASVFIVALLCFILGAVAGKHFGDKRKEYVYKNSLATPINNEINREHLFSPQNELRGKLSDSKRNIASSNDSRRTIIVGKKQPDSNFTNTNRKIASTPNKQPNDPTLQILSGKYTIVVTAYEDRDKTIIHVEDLRSRGLVQAFIPQYMMKISQTYKVNIGVYDSREDALERKENLSKLIDLKDATIETQN